MLFGGLFPKLSLRSGTKEGLDLQSSPYNSLQPARICPGADGGDSFPFQPQGRNLVPQQEVELAEREGAGPHPPVELLPRRPPPAAAATHMAEDHGLSNGDGPVDITQGLELLISAIAQDIILLDGVQRLLLALQFDDVWVWDHFLGKFPDRVFEGGREKQHLAVPGKHPAREGPGVQHDPDRVFHWKEQKHSLPRLG